jgi:hypothetical protein
MVNRRSFLKRLGGGLLAIAAAPLVVPPRAPVYIPSDRLEMGVPRPIATAPAIEMPAELWPPRLLNPTAYFASGDTGLVQGSTMTWKDVFMRAEEIDVTMIASWASSGMSGPFEEDRAGLEASEKKYGIRAAAWDRGWRA